MRTTNIIRLSGVTLPSTVSLHIKADVQRFGGTMSIHRIPKISRPVARERTINPLWMVTFAAGLLFGMLAVLLTSG